MKKWSLSLMMMLALVLAACSGKPDWKAEITKEPVFSSGKESQLVLSVSDNSSPVSGLSIKAQLSMVDMDHGSFNAVLEEQEDGTYAAKVKLPMAGKWEAVFTLEKDGEQLEQVAEMNVEKADGVAAINGELITKEDLDFYAFINELHIEMARETDRGKYSGDELEEAMAYWDMQLEMNENQNQLIAQIIRLRAMALLGNEKGHTASEQEVKNEIAKVRSQYNESPAAKQLIEKYGEEKFWKYQQEQYERIVLTQKVQQDVMELVKKEKPKASEQEVQFTAEKKYEELLVSQVESLKIELL
jgi:hypothetical protein